MLIFAKDYSLRDHRHALEDQDSGLKEYMEYHRKLFPYTVFRAGLDLAYKELDDILNYVDNRYQPPPDSPRKEYPPDVDEWFREQYSWASNFLNKDAVHSTLVVLIQGMESARTYEKMNVYHRMVLYDVVHNAIRFYNDLLTFSSDRANDLRLSQKIRINFDDFVNSYWTSLDFMIMSKPDYPHKKLLSGHQKIEEEIRRLIGDGDPPPIALEKAGQLYGLEETTIACLRHDPISQNALQLKSISMEENPYETLNQSSPDNPDLSCLDREFLLDYEIYKKSKP